MIVGGEAFLGFAELAAAPVPAKTPRPIAEKVHAEMKRIMAAPDMRDKIAGVGLIPNDSPSIEEMRGYIASEHVKWGALVKQLGLEGATLFCAILSDVHM